MRLAGVVCLLVGCSFEHGQSNTRSDSSMGIVDAPEIDGPPGCKSFSTHINTCTQLIAGNPLTLAGANTYDTDQLVLTTPNGNVTLPTRVITTTDGEIVVAFVASFTLSSGATLRVDGNDLDRPLGIVATGAISVEGAIDVSNNGAGARNDAQCGTQVGVSGADDSGGASGGGGAAFAGAGGKGGDGDSDGGASTGGAGGTPVATRPAHVRGGCDGGPGGDGFAENGGPAGDGGGAIFFASATSITIGGSINAGGGGGGPGRSNGGGGGGGAGGMIVLESGAVTISGKLAANGGGGGEGGDGSDAGSPGSPGELTTTRAAGGSGASSEGADGGTGGAAGNAAGLAPTQIKKGGGGGGGGGAGFIGIGGSSPVTSGTTVISPAYQAWP